MTDPRPIVLEATSLHKTYHIGNRPVPVLHDVSLRLERGESLAVTGPSGAGKTTLLYLLAALDVPSSGGVTILDRDLFAAPQRQRTLLRARHVGFVFQAYHLLPELDVLENVLLPSMTLPRRFQPPGSPRERARRLLDAVGLSHRVAHMPRELSGGEQQRAAIARALINRPSILFADEPTGNLDTATGALVLDALFRLVAEAEGSLVLVTHNADLASKCSRQLHLVDGRICEA